MDLKKKPTSFITSYYRTREKFGAALLGGAMAGKSAVNFQGRSFSATAADGKNLFAKDHPAKVSGKARPTCFGGRLLRRRAGSAGDRHAEFPGRQ